MAERQTAAGVMFQWDGDNWTDESENLISANGTLEFVPPGESFLASKQVIQQATVVLANRDQRYSIENTNSPIYDYIAGGALYKKRCRILFLVGGESEETETIFTGFIKLPTYNYGKNTVTFQVWDVGEIIKKKYSTTMLTDYLEHEIVVYYLELAGLVDGVDFISPTYATEHSTTETIEYSSVPVPYSWLDDEPVLNEIVDLAQSSGSRVYVDREGMIHYERNRLWASTPTYTPETFDLTNLGDLNIQYDDKAFYDAITVEYSERTAGAGPEELWKLQKPKLLLPGQTETIVARYRYPALLISTPVANTTYFVTDLSGNDMSGSVTITLSPSYAQQSTINITNTLGIAIMLSSMTIQGVAIHGLPAEQYEIANEGDYGRRIDVRGNPYLQTRLQARVAGDFLAWWYSNLKILFPLNGVRGHPTRDLGRRVTVQWYNRGTDTTHTYNAIIVSCKWNLNIDPLTRAIKYTQDLTALEDVFDDGVDYFNISVSSFGDGSLLWY